LHAESLSDSILYSMSIIAFINPVQKRPKNKFLKTRYIQYVALIIIITLVLFTSCKNDIDYIKSLSDEANIPHQTGKNFEIQYTDSGRLQVLFRAPVIERYMKGGKEGSYYFYNKNEQLESVITSRYAKYWEEKNLGVARDSVVGRNIKSGEQLNTEELYWDREKHQIYSKVFTKITNEDGVYFGERGFEADQGFENYKLLGSSGSVKVKDEAIE
jgi:LPS export ABC transporter protein LptC